MSASQDEAIIRKRLRVNEGPLKRAFVKYQSLAKTTQNPSDEDCDTLRDSLEREFRFNELQLNKAQSVWSTNVRELNDYETLYQERERSIDEVQAEIEALKLQLKEEKIKRKYKEEYDALSKIINESPSRAATLREIDGMKAEIEELNKEDEEAAQKLALRSKQFQFLLYALEDLHRTLHKEKETEPTQMEVETKDATSAMQT